MSENKVSPLFYQAEGGKGERDRGSCCSVGVCDGKLLPPLPVPAAFPIRCMTCLSDAFEVSSSQRLLVYTG